MLRSAQQKLLELHKHFRQRLLHLNTTSQKYILPNNTYYQIIPVAGKHTLPVACLPAVFTFQFFSSCQSIHSHQYFPVPPIYHVNRLPQKIPLRFDIHSQTALWGFVIPYVPTFLSFVSTALKSISWLWLVPGSSVLVSLAPRSGREAKGNSRNNGGT